MTVDALAVFTNLTAKPTAAPKSARAEPPARVSDTDKQGFDRALDEREVDHVSKDRARRINAGERGQALEAGDEGSHDVDAALDGAAVWGEMGVQSLVAPPMSESVEAVDLTLDAAMGAGGLDRELDPSAYLPSQSFSAALNLAIEEDTASRVGHPDGEDGAVGAPTAVSVQDAMMEAARSASGLPEGPLAAVGESVVDPEAVGLLGEDANLDADLEAELALAAQEQRLLGGEAGPEMEGASVSHAQAARDLAKSLAAAPVEVQARPEVAALERQTGGRLAPTRPLTAQSLQGVEAAPGETALEGPVSGEVSRFEALLSGLETGRRDLRPEPSVAVKTETAQPAATAQPLVRNVLSRLEEIELAEGKTRVLLRPQGLGTIEIDILRQGDGRMQVVMRVENPLILEALRQDEEQINRFMDEQGFDLASGGAQFAAYDQDARDSGAAGSDRAQGAAGDAALLGADVAAHDEGAAEAGVISASELNILT